jgi:hypothetical protein
MLTKKGSLDFAFRVLEALIKLRIQYYHINVNKQLKANCSQIITNAGNAHKDKQDVPTNMDRMIVVKSDAAGRDTVKSDIVTCFCAADAELKVGEQCRDDVQGEVSPFPSGERLSRDSSLIQATIQQHLRQIPIRSKNPRRRSSRHRATMCRQVHRREVCSEVDS